MQINLPSVQYPFNILVISDTHLRKGSLPDFLMQAFMNLRPEMILHCGDISTPGILSDLQEIATVYAVRGNRDLFSWFTLAPSIDLTVDGRKIHMEHGQGGIPEYLAGKIKLTYLRIRKLPVPYDKFFRLAENYDAYDLYCCGHTHYPKIMIKGRTLAVNPGHLDLTGKREPCPPSFILITFEEKKLSARLFSVINDRIIEEENSFPKCVLAQDLQET